MKSSPDPTFLYYGRKVLWQTYIVILGVVVTLLLPLYFVTFIPSILVRPFVAKLGKYLRPDIAGILNCSATALAQTDEEGKPEKIVIVIQAKFRGLLTKGEICKLVEEKWISCRNEETGCLKYPELQQSIVSFLGYKFWQWEKSFSVQDHVKGPETNPKTREEVEAIGPLLLSTRFQEGKSPWEMVVVSGVVMDGVLSSVLYVKIHHSIADGLSLLFLFRRLFGEEDIQRPLNPQVVPWTLSRILSLPFSIAKGYGEFAYLSSGKSCWLMDESKKSFKWNSAATQPISVKGIRKIRKQFGGSFISVVFAIMAGGISRYLSRRKLIKENESLAFALPVPVNIHSYNPNQLLNKSFSFMISTLPVGTRNPLARLSEMEASFSSIRASPLPLLGYLMFNLQGTQPNFYGKIINTFGFAPLATSYFPIGDVDWRAEGCPLTGISYTVKAHQGTVGIMITVSSANDEIRYSVAGNENLISSKEVSELCRDIEEEARALSQILDKEEKMKNQRLKIE